MEATRPARALSDTATLRALSAARMAELGRQYLARTQEELLPLDDLLSQAAAGDNDAWIRIAEVAHRISGAGATLGFPALSSAASVVESVALDNRSTLARLAVAVRVLRQRLEGAL